jgi:NAD(P)-dependent dehydrogenase (short-subunit alcohol dehydrogenase family)
MKDLNDKVVVITGAGSGMGREMALLAAKRGALLAVSDWNEPALAETVDLLKAAGVRELRSDVVDVSDRAAVADLATAVVEQFGRVNMVVNNAGVTVTGDFEEMAYDDFDWIVGVNFMGVVHGTKEFLPHLIASGDGAVVNISSLFGLIAPPTQVAYVTSKYGVRGFSEALRHELAGQVGVTVVHPGGIRTGIATSARLTGVDVDGRQAAQAAEFTEKALTMPPEEAAKLIVAAVQARKPRLVITRIAKAADVLARLAPARYWTVIQRQLDKRGM